MYNILELVFLFFTGSIIGYIFELFLRRFIHGKWVNPGFLVGPYLPIYGFGLIALTIIYKIFIPLNLNPLIEILLMGISLTIIELIGGIIFLKNNVRLWDYRDRWLNYKGVICPLFSIIWIIMSALYYYFLSKYVINALNLLDNNILFSYILGLFSGLMLIDFIYSTNLYAKIRKFAKENDITVKYEKLKIHIKEKQKEAKEKYSFIFAFKQTKNLREYLNEYMEKLRR